MKKSKSKKKSKNVEVADVDEMKPSLYLQAKDLPAIKDWEVGNKYTLLVEVEMTGMSMRQGRDDDKEHYHGDFEITDIKVKDDKDDFEKGFDSDSYGERDRD